MDYYAIGQRIRMYRKACNLSQEQLSEVVDISITHMSHIETGNTKLSLPVIKKIADALEVHIDDLIYEKEKQSKIDISEDIITVLNTCSKKQLCIILELIVSTKKVLEKNDIK